MTKSVVVLGIIFGLTAGASYAGDPEVLKKQDVRACEAQTQQQTNDKGKQVQKTCECEIENTDYEDLAKAKKDGDLAKIQKIKQEAKEVCTE